ncbi:MAG: hypothetical protein DRH11_18405 [Deltaproteobacteria bacterium]|nr:MAG: hypothetical protein DRH11_18405 [Deltaproteobacteria bacterium]
MAKSKGVVVLNFRLSPRKRVSPSTIEKVIALMKNAPKPILVHCKAGADRSGLICAIWRLVSHGDQPQRAYKQLSLLYGHVPYMWSKTKAMDRSFWRYVEYFRAQAPGHDTNAKASHVQKDEPLGYSPSPG